MRIIISEFISLDGIVQAPGGVDEDTDDGFENFVSRMAKLSR